MKVEIQHGPGASAAILNMEVGETISSEAGSMIAMSSGVTVETTTHKKKSGNIFGGLKRMLAGESFFMNHYSASQEGDHVWVSSTLSGDMQEIELDGNTKVVLQSGSYVASEESIDVGLDWQGFKSLFAKEGLFWINLKGSGKAVINSFGAIYSIDVDGEYIVDTGHIVGFEETLAFSLSKAGKSWLSSILGGEGLVCRFKGQGRIWCQSHHPSSFGHILGSMLRPRR
jgi:uncharacterized protein (TIGR00266 family)